MGQRSAPAQAVSEFVLRARATARGSKALVRAIERETGDSYTTGAVDAWAQGRSSPPGHILFALARHYHLSLDDFATGLEPVALHRQMKEVVHRLSVIRMRVDELLAVAGRPGIDYEMAVPEERTV